MRDVYTEPMTDFALARQRMVEEQIAVRGITNPRVLDAMRDVPRHLFVPEGQRHNAYEDHPLPIGHGQTISQPYMVAAMVDALDLQAQHRVLEIGTGSGYQTAVLARLAATVYSIEVIEALAWVARRSLQQADVRNVRLKVGDGHEGWPEFAPFDRVVVSAAARTMPFRLVEQLVSGGRIVVPVGPESAQVLTVGIKRGERLIQRPLMPCVFVPFVQPARAEAR